MGSLLSKCFSSREESQLNLEETAHSTATITDNKTSCPKTQLTNRQIVRLAAAISADNMAAIAEGYMNIKDETIKNIRRDASNSEEFNREIIKFWVNTNSGPNQAQVRGISFQLPIVTESKL